ncbi:MAG: hypothetical protein M3416_02165 [Acidobacteriota bacterium]|nr:hypothetical protein [Acidobacteriota bacterium]
MAVSKKQKRKPVRRYTVRVYDEAVARRLEGLAESNGYREMSAFFVESPLRNAEGGLSPWELQALEILTFQLGVQSKITAQALGKLKKDKNTSAQEALLEQAAQSKEVLALVQAILGPKLSPGTRGR